MPVLVGGVLFAITLTSLIAYMVAKHRRFRSADRLPAPMLRKANSPTSNASQFGGGGGAHAVDVSRHAPSNGASNEGVSDT